MISEARRQLCASVGHSERGIRLQKPPPLQHMTGFIRLGRAKTEKSNHSDQPLQGELEVGYQSRLRGVGVPSRASVDYFEVLAQRPDR